MSLNYNPSGGASALKSQYAKAGPCGADTVAKSVGRAQPTAGKGMGYGPAQAAKCLYYWDREAPKNDGPRMIKGY